MGSDPGRRGHLSCIIQWKNVQFVEACLWNDVVLIGFIAIILESNLPIKLLFVENFVLLVGVLNIDFSYVSKWLTHILLLRDCRLTLGVGVDKVSFQLCETVILTLSVRR